MAADIPSQNQRLHASRPDVSAWVAANAGAGKTSLLTDRVLRLLLAGAEPSRILCITYTKAGAAEMEGRILDTLGKWAVMGEAPLTAALQKLTGVPPHARLAARARSLFALIADAPEGLRIQTIHAFCQSLLARFPLEAGIAPYAELMDERTSGELLHESAQRLFVRSAGEPEGKLAQSLGVMASRMPENSFHSLLGELAGARRRLRWLVEDAHRLESGRRRLYAMMGVKEGDTAAAYFTEAFPFIPEHEENLRAALRELVQSNKKSDMELAARLEPWLRTPPEQRFAVVEDYLSAYITEKGTPRDKLSTKDCIRNEDACEALREEQRRAVEYLEKARSLAIADLSAGMLEVAQALYGEYEAIKRGRALLDYDDLIIAAVRLLGTPGIAPWVMYKLDGGIDHVLVDEAQDTSHEQWDIVQRLTEEFFAGRGRREEETRTLFVVGDVKQSIFRFQGAEPEAFDAMRGYFAERVKAAGLLFADAELPESFRSAAPVLEAVDAVFAQEEVLAGTGGAHLDVRHVLTREGAAGRVELWPLASEQKEEGAPPAVWQVARTREAQQRPLLRLAAEIARKVAGWLKEGEMLESQGRPVRAGDIMILVQRRGELAPALVRALKQQAVPVAGMDRLALAENLAVMDLCALLQFLLLPQDDLTLAALLKSPLFDIDEEALYTLAHARDGMTLWQALQRRVSWNGAFAHAQGFLAELLAHADRMPPYEMLSYVLEERGGRARIIGRMGVEYHEPLDELMTQALVYEAAHTPSLQGFVQWLRRGTLEVKRDMEQGRGEEHQGEVRVMTVHGAKGLEAPIVILPDTVATPGKKDRLLWCGQDGSSGSRGDGFALWSPGAKQDNRIVAECRSHRQRGENAQYHRLLYVAMTRARDRLYLCGYQGKKAPFGHSWYQLVSKAFTAMPGVVEIETPFGKGWRRVSAQHKAPEEKAAARARTVFPPIPAALFTPPPAHPPLARPLTASRLGMEEIPPGLVASPLLPVDLFARGTLLHRVLQYLPDVPPPQREEAARGLLKRFAEGISAAECEVLAQQALAVITAPEAQAFFAAGSVAEVPLAGKIRLHGEEIPIAGQIDRLRVGEKDIWILDYKSNARPPQRLERIPVAYLRQMAAYRALMAEIYPGRNIHCALLWTAGPTLMPLPEAMLEKALGAREAISA